MGSRVEWVTAEAVDVIPVPLGWESPDGVQVDRGCVAVELFLGGMSVIVEGERSEMEKLARRLLEAAQAAPMQP